MHIDLHLARRIATLPHNYPRDCWGAACDILAASGQPTDTDRAKRLSALLWAEEQREAERVERAAMAVRGCDPDLWANYHAETRGRRWTAVLATLALIVVTVAAAHAALSAPAVVYGTLEQADSLRGW